MNRNWWTEKEKIGWVVLLSCEHMVKGVKGMKKPLKPIMGQVVQTCRKYSQCSIEMSYLGCIVLHSVSRVTNACYLETDICWAKISCFVPWVSHMLKVRYFSQISCPWNPFSSHKRKGRGGGNQRKLRNHPALASKNNLMIGQESQTWRNWLGKPHLLKSSQIGTTTVRAPELLQE